MSHQCLLIKPQFDERRHSKRVLANKIVDSFTFILHTLHTLLRIELYD